MANLQKYNLKMYKYPLGTFLRNISYKCPLNMDNISNYSNTNPTVEDVDTAIKFVYGTIPYYWYIPPSKLFAPHLQNDLLKFVPANVIDVTQYENQTIEIKLDEHRSYRVTFGALTHTFNTAADESWSMSFSTDCYLDGIKVSPYPLSDQVRTYVQTRGGVTNAHVNTRGLLDITSPKNTTRDNSGILYSTTGRLRYRSDDLPPQIPYEETVSVDTQYSLFYDNVYDEWYGGYEPDIPDDGNPWDDNGYSGEDSGDSNFTENSDDIDLDALPSIDAVGTGFATLFTPTKPQLKSLADIMWSNGIFQALQNLVENISDMFTSLAMVPFTVENAGNVTVMFLGLIDTTVTLRLASKQFYEFNMGSINLATDDRIYSSGTCLDYSPFSKLGIFLPFIGYQDLDIDECRGCVINLKYRIDILSGACVALISLNGNTIYQFSGNCLTQIPITNENMQSLVSDAINVGIAASNARSAVGAASADIGHAEKSAMSQPKKDAVIAHAEAHQTTAMNQLHSATANAAMGLKPTFGKAGAISAASSMLAVKQPYLFLTTPRANIPFHYQKYCGFPSNITGKLSDFSGYTVVEDIRLNGLVATAPEVAEIYSLLKSGVII